MINTMKNCKVERPHLPNLYHLYPVPIPYNNSYFTDIFFLIFNKIIQYMRLPTNTYMWKLDYGCKWTFKTIQHYTN